MRTLQEVRSLIEQRTTTIRAATAERMELVKEWGPLAAKRKIGDEFVQKGYPHDGKLVRITEMRFRCVGDGDPRITYLGFLVRKDGSLSNVAFSFNGDER